MPFIRAVALTLCLFLAVATAVAQDAKPYTQEENRVFTEVHGVGLLMDIFTPTGPKNGLGMVDIGSGAWFSDRGKISDHEKAQVYNILSKHGYTVFVVRPGSRTAFTAAQMASHVKLGIRYVKAHAADFGVDPDKLGLMGASAGGHLALLVTLSPEEGDPSANEKNYLRRFDTKTFATCAFFPPTDFLDWGGKKGDFTKLGDILFVGGITGKSDAEIEEAAKKISPALMVTGKTQPILLVHGDADDVVPLQQSQKMEKLLKDAGTDVKLIVKPGGGHPWLTIPQEMEIMAQWFDEKFGIAPAKP